MRRYVVLYKCVYSWYDSAFEIIDFWESFYHGQFKTFQKYDGQVQATSLDFGVSMDLYIDRDVLGLFTS